MLVLWSIFVSSKSGFKCPTIPPFNKWESCPAKESFELLGLHLKFNPAKVLAAQVILPCLSLFSFDTTLYQNEPNISSLQLLFHFLRGAAQFYQRSSTRFNNCRF